MGMINVSLTDSLPLKKLDRE